MIDSYFSHLLISIGICLILAVSLQLSLGYSGLLNLGHMAFMGIGAYAYAISAIHGFPFILCISLAAVLAGFFGFLLSVSTNTLRGEYLALVSLGFNFLIYAVLMNWTELTRGPLGIPGIPRPTIAGLDFSNNILFLFLILLIAAFSCLFFWRLTHSPFGKALEATRDDELAARTLGKNTFKLKNISLATSAFFAGMAGGLFACYFTSIDPSSFAFANLMPILLVVVIGGLTSLPGTFLATIIVVLLPEVLRFVGFPPQILAPLRQIIYALLLILIIYFKPRGFYGKIDLE